ncbi:MAG: helix-turn-helix domain-containing protein, partial [Phycisphaerae bacterium]
AGAPVDVSPLLVPPSTIVPRHSTDLLSVDDPDIAEAARFIRENAAMPMTVEDVHRKVMISRRKLEVGFKRNFHRTPQKEIWRVRVTKAKALLEQTSSKMPRIAQLSGFSNADRLCEIFRRETGVTPRAWRERSRSV